MGTGPKWSKMFSLRALEKLIGAFFLVFLYFFNFRENLNGHRYMATGKWPTKDQQKAPRSFSHFFACFCPRFRPFSHFFRSFSHFFQGKTPWVAPACADCPGFLVLGSAPAPASAWSRILRLFPWASILLHGPLDIAWICCPQLPCHPWKNGTHSTLASQKIAIAEKSLRFQIAEY